MAVTVAPSAPRVSAPLSPSPASPAAKSVITLPVAIWPSVTLSVSGAAVGTSSVTLTATVAAAVSPSVSLATTVIPVRLMTFWPAALGCGKLSSSVTVTVAEPLVPCAIGSDGGVRSM